MQTHIQMQVNIDPANDATVHMHCMKDTRRERMFFNVFNLMLEISGPYFQLSCKPSSPRVCGMHACSCFEMKRHSSILSQIRGKCLKFRVHDDNRL